MDHVDKILAQWNAERSDLDVWAMGPLGRLARIHHSNSRQTAATFAKFGINSAGFDLLATLRRSGPPFAMTPGALLKSMMITSGTMTNRIDQLSKAGLVERRPGQDDARQVFVHLTPAGFDLIEQAVEAHVQTQSSLLAALSPHEVQQLDDLARKLLAASGSA